MVCVLWNLQWLPKGLTLNRYYLAPDPREADYIITVQTVQSLSAKVLAPEDPTIVYKATGALTFNIFIEADIGGMLNPLPPKLAVEFASAEYVVDVHNWMGDYFVYPERLENLGFKKEKDLGFYSLWRKTAR